MALDCKNKTLNDKKEIKIKHDDFMIFGKKQI